MKCCANSWLREVEPVLSVEVNGVARAYPLQILIWHEIVNDELAGTPIVVTFCPLCYSALVFERPQHNGTILTFGTSGNLRNSDLVMWDRQTESWWQQFTGEAIVGSLLGTELTMLPASIISWRSFREAYPEADVLSRETGIKRAYGKNPYEGYDDIAKKPFLYQGKVSKGLPPMAHIIGIERGKNARAYPVDVLRTARVIEDTLAGDALVLFYQEGTASALDRTIISEGEDRGAISVFSPVVDGRLLHFSAIDRAFVDLETKTHWSIVGKATSGPLSGHQLRALPHHRVFWFAWSAFVADRGSLYQK